MSFLDLAKERFSVRRFDARPVEQEKLDRILEAGNVAPTGCNNQPQRVYVLKSAEALAKIRSLTRCAFDAPVRVNPTQTEAGSVTQTCALCGYTQTVEVLPPEAQREESRFLLGDADADGHIEIVRVIDCETRDDVDPMNWARHFVWNWACKYSQ